MSTSAPSTSGYILSFKLILTEGTRIWRIVSARFSIPLHCLKSIILVAWRLRKQSQMGNPFSWVGALAGLFLIGSGADTLLQMILAISATKVGAEAFVTLIFAFLPIALGLLTIRLSLFNQSKTSIRSRVYLIIMGVASLFLWAGLFIGPILAFTTAIMPTKLGKAKKQKSTRRTILKAKVFFH